MMYASIDPCKPALQDLSERRRWGGEEEIAEEEENEEEQEKEQEREQEKEEQERIEIKHSIVYSLSN